MRRLQDKAGRPSRGCPPRAHGHPDQWLEQQLAELAAAEQAGDSRRTFETKIRIGAAEAMFAAWEAWRTEHNIFPHLFEEVNP